MGIGDEILATGMARGAAARGRKIAFGDGRRLIWGPFCEQAFRHNPNIARSPNEPGVEWLHYHKGNRQYNKLGSGRWIWNYAFKAQPGEFFFDERERSHTIRRAVLIEPNVPWHKPVAPNKDWGLANYQALADRLLQLGLDVWQTSYGDKRLRGVQLVPVTDFRIAAAALAGFDLAICPEGGLHHAAAAVGTPAVVLFGGFIPAEVTGYDGHVNLTGGAAACGSLRECSHCREAMGKISVEEVCQHAIRFFQ
jgi:hypothetical protein